MDIPKELNERFILDEELLTRPNSVIYKGKDRTLGDRVVAVKLFFNLSEGNEEWVSEFSEEVEKIRKTSHPVLVPVVGGGCEQGWFYIAMEYIPGASLHAKLAEKKIPFSMDEAVEIAVKLAAALGDMHESGVRHGHVSSRSVLFKDHDVRLAGYCPKVIEKIQQGKSTDGRLLVDPAYVAPEQISGGVVDKRADVFSLSVLLCEMVTGERPFKAANPLQMAMKRLSSRPPAPAKLNPEVGPLLDAAIMKGLAADPGERYSSTAAFAEAITGGRGGEESSSGETPGGGAIPIGTQTIGVSMSTESIRDMLKKHDSAEPDAVPSAKPLTKDAEGQSVESTMVGVQALSPDALKKPVGTAAPASLIVLNEDLRGQKFLLQGERTMLGSAPECEIKLSGKDIPARYAIVVRQESEYRVGGLSAAGVRVNEETNTTGEDITLRRGDVIHVGKYLLRFVEANEVFTLQDDVADRVIDRPQSKIPKVLLLSAVAVAVVCIMLFFAYEHTRSGRALEGQRKTAQAAAERKRVISALRKEGDTLLKEGVLEGPKEPNAKERFQKILELDPDDTYAKRRLAEIHERVRLLALEQERAEKHAQKIERLMSEAGKQFVAGKYIAPPGGNARETYREVLRLDPNNEAAKTKLAKIRQILDDLVGKVGGFVAAAKTYKENGKYVAPPGKNAYEMLQRVLRIDPDNDEAKTMLYEMAAQSIVVGDEAKAAARLKDMKRAYLTAQALGVDPAYIKPRLRGTDIIKKSRSEYIYVDRKSKVTTSSSGTDRYLDTAELERKVAEFKLQESITGRKERKKFIDVGSMRE